MQVDNTNITVDEKDEARFKDYGPSLFGNIFDYSSFTEDEGEVEKRENDEEDSRKEEVKIVEEKYEADRLEDTWKNVMHESMYMPHLEKTVIEFDKLCFQHEVDEPFVTPIVLVTLAAVVAFTTTAVECALWPTTC